MIEIISPYNASHAPLLMSRARSPEKSPCAARKGQQPLRNAACGASPPALEAPASDRLKLLAESLDACWTPTLG